MKLIARIVVACGVLMAFSTPSLAAPRTWVSGVGNDADPCSRTAPCKTFAGAYIKTDAGGVISVLDPGGYGSVTISKALTIDGGGLDGSILGANTHGITVNAAATDHVTIRNVTIYGVGNGLNGVRVLSAARVTLQNVTITGFNNGIDFNSAGYLVVHDSYIHDNRNFGVYFRSGRGSFDRVRLEDNALDGLRVGNGGIATISNSVVSGHANIGLSATEAATARLTVDTCIVTNNAYGVGAATGATVNLTNSTVSYNTVNGVWRDAASFMISWTNNRLVSNAADVAYSSSVIQQ